MNNKIILGTVQFGLKYGINNTLGQMSEKVVFKILDLAQKSNIKVLDTAAAYGNSELRIGNYIQSHHVNDKLRVITKFNLKQGATSIESLECSLQNLKVSHVDTIMFHNFDDFTNAKPEEIEELLKLKGSKYSKLGISLYTNEQIEIICENNLFEVVQIPFNALDNHRLRGESICKLKAKNIETHTRSVFLQGLFFMDFNKIPQKLRPLAKYLDKIDAIARKYNVDKAALALHYALSKSYIDGVLVGVDSYEQMEINIQMIRVKIPFEAITELDHIEVEESNLLNPALWNL